MFSTLAALKCKKRFLRLADLTPRKKACPLAPSTKICLWDPQIRGDPGALAQDGK